MPASFLQLARTSATSTSSNRTSSNRTSSTRTARRRALRTGTVSGAALLLVAVGAGAASAHVTVTPDQAEAGGYVTLTFKVPNESATASTTAVEVALPADTPFTSVSVEPVPGWSAQVATTELPAPVEVHGTEITEAPVTVVWTADSEDAAIDPGEFRRFTVSAGAVPHDVDTILLPATQTYSDGEVVAWDEPAGEDGAEPEHPAPTLVVTPAPTGSGGAHGSGAHGDEGTAAEGTAAEGTAAEDATAGDGASGGSGPLALGLGAAGLGLGLVGAVTGVVALARTRARTPR
ncbi:YcnI family protein [Isoptericola sp. NEAU-Y5]|uniref:YcnI family protein n=1 Tax=Isoptericola luteus TaxID=2879484 RepID=A0ABS7ZJS6_9MICO|nr:YcnI family protein [Isoptericola sp. NEAU-Y5]MCA5894772.1 YcnI family protein [Isoptericola sp. NEAU-Y5]